MKEDVGYLGFYMHKLKPLKVGFKLHDDVKRTSPHCSSQNRIII